MRHAAMVLLMESFANADAPVRRLQLTPPLPLRTCTNLLRAPVLACSPVACAPVACAPVACAPQPLPQQQQDVEDAPCGEADDERLPLSPAFLPLTPLCDSPADSLTPCSALAHGGAPLDALLLVGTTPQPFSLAAPECDTDADTGADAAALDAATPSDVLPPSSPPPEPSGFSLATEDFTCVAFFDGWVAPDSRVRA